VSWISFDCRKELPGFTLDARWESSRGVVALLGRSGCGKTLTLRCIAGLERPDRGRIRIGERLLFDSSAGVNVPPHRRRIGFVFQHYALFPHLTVRQNVLFGFPENGRAGRDAALAELVALCRLEGLVERYPREISGGQRQRVAIARALASDPAVLLLDEPFAALDRQTRDEVVGELQSILDRTRVPTVLVTHDAQEAEALAEELILMEGGAVAGVRDERRG
jgi:molybdate transport system ATP-binding protein